MTARRRSWPALLLLAATVPAAGCAATGASGGDNPFQGAAGSRAVTIEVENLNFNDATVWAESPGGQHRLGVVSGKSNRTFTLEWTRAQQLNLRIRLTGGGECRTRSVTTDPGDSFQVQVPVNLRSSRFCR